MAIHPHSRPRDPDGLLIGAILIVLTSRVYEAFAQGFFRRDSTALNEVYVSYRALFTGAFGDLGKIIRALKVEHPTRSE